jgi:hypothetical protein
LAGHRLSGSLDLICYLTLWAFDQTFSVERFERTVRGSDSERAQMVFTDPPYNVLIAGHVGGSGGTKHREFAMASVACTRFRRHRVRCFHGTGGSRRASSSQQPLLIVFAWVTDTRRANVVARAIARMRHRGIISLESDGQE